MASLDTVHEYTARIRQCCLLVRAIVGRENTPSHLYAGLSDVPGEAMVKLYCPRCMDVYLPKSSKHHHTDGAYFGTGFPHMVFFVHPELRPKRPQTQFVPRCDVFSGHPTAYTRHFADSTALKYTRKRILFSRRRRTVCSRCQRAPCRISHRRSDRLYSVARVHIARTFPFVVYILL